MPPGAKVSAGETIGAVGTTHPGEGELSDGPHEHFGIVTQDAIDAYNRKYGTRISVAPNGGESGGLGFRTGQTELFENPDEFTNYADGAPYNTRTYIPIRDGLASRSVPNLAQSQDADQPLSQRNPANRAGLSPVELNRFYTDTGNHAPDQLASIVDGTLRVAIPNGASGSAASGFPRDNIPTPNLYLDGMKAARPLFGMVPPSNAPLNPVHAIPDGTANPATPNSPAPQSNRRSALPDGVTSTLAQAASPSGVAFAPSGPNAPASLFSRLMSAGPDAFLAADDTASPPSQARATQNVADNRPMRFLVGRTYDPSQGSPFKAQPAPAPASPDGSLSLGDAYLEYLKRLNAA